MKNYIPFVLVLALATSVLSTPIPASRRASGIVVKYSDKYPAENEAPTRSGVSETITLSDIEELLSADVPLPSTLLMALPSIKAKAAAPVATPAATTTQTWDPATVELQQMLANVVTRSMCLALAGFAGCFLALVACTIQRFVPSSKPLPLSSSFLNINPQQIH